MSKLLSAYNNAFATVIPSISELYDLAMSISSINGLYLAMDGSIDKSFVNANGEEVVTWYDMSGSTNYLYSEPASRPLFVPSDSVLNNNSSIAFNIDGSDQMLFKYPQQFKTIIIVYYLKQHGSYLLYAPLQTLPPDSLFYDLFPSYSDRAWSTCSLSSNFAYNSDTRINTSSVSPTSFLPLNSPRILTVSNLDGVSSSASIQGIGGRNGIPNGGERTSGIVDSVKGNIAAILTFTEDLDDNTLTELELKLREAYVNYTGSAVIEDKKFKYLYNQNIYYDFSEIVIDEWSSPTTYELLSPSTLNLAFTGSVLSGTASIPYEGKIIVRITNEIGLVNTFEFDFEINRPDPLVLLLPEQNSISLALSSSRDIDGYTYGVYKDSENIILRWEDARRIGNELKILSPNTVSSTYDLSTTPPSVVIPNGSKLTGGVMQGRSMLWVYKQRNIDNRPMLDGFSDRKGNGVFWTTENTSQIFGQTDITALRTYVNKVQVSTLLYRNSTDKLNFITAIQPNNVSVPFYGLDSMLGELYFLVVWDKQLTTSDMNTAIELIADRYVPDQAPFIVSTATEFRLSSDVQVDLSTKVVDLKNRALTYNIVQNHYSATITGDILSFTAVTDELLEFSIEVTNTSNYTTTLTFKVDVTLRTNSLYLSLKEYFNALDTPPIVSDIFLATSDSVLLSSGNILSEWKDYRLNSKTGIATGLATVLSDALDNKLGIQFSDNGSSYLDLSVDITSSDFLIVYVKSFNITGDVFLFGNDTAPLFSGNVDNLINTSVASPSVVFGTKYVNGIAVDSSYTLPPNVLNVVYLHTTAPVTINTIAKDRMFTDRGIKGIVPLIFMVNRELSSTEVDIVDSLVRDYYDPLRFVLLLHFNNSLADSSSEGKVLSGSSSYSTISKFGSHSLQALDSSNVNILRIPNNRDLAYLKEDFTISCWIAITNALATNTIFYLYRQTDLNIYIDSTYLYVGRNTSSYLIRYLLPLDFYNTQVTFQHIEIDKVEEGLTLYVNGVAQGLSIDTLEYIDTLSDGLIGGINNPNSTNAIIYIDEFVIFKRGAIHTDNFTPSSSEYSI
jgi:hypothetical protein